MAGDVGRFQHTELRGEVKWSISVSEYLPISHALLNERSFVFSSAVCSHYLARAERHRLPVFFRTFDSRCIPTRPGLNIAILIPSLLRSRGHFKKCVN